jgi:hypothetical protein
LPRAKTALPHRKRGGRPWPLSSEAVVVLFHVHAYRLKDSFVTCSIDSSFDLPGFIPIDSRKMPKTVLLFEWLAPFWKGYLKKALASRCCLEEAKSTHLVRSILQVGCAFVVVLEASISDNAECPV